MEWTSCLIDGVPTLKCLEVLFSNALGALGGIIFLVLLGMFFLGSFKWMTAGDDPAKLKTAKGTFYSALMGLVIIASSYVILRVLESVFGINLTVFKIPT